MTAPVATHVSLIALICHPLCLPHFYQSESSPGRPSGRLLILHGSPLRPADSPHPTKGGEVIRTYTISEASKLTGIPKHSLYRAHREGRLQAARERGTKRGLRVTEEAIETYWKELVDGPQKETDPAKAESAS